MVFFKEMKCALAASMMTSQDPLIRHLATRSTIAEEKAKRPVFKPHQEVITVIKEDPEVSRKQTLARIKSKVFHQDTKNHAEHSSGLTRQG